MANFADNILTIDNGVYGKDIRQAIKENLELDHKSLNDLIFELVNLQSRVDALSGGGDSGGGGGSSSSGSMAFSVALEIKGRETDLISIGEAIPI